MTKTAEELGIAGEGMCWTDAAFHAIHEGGVLVHGRPTLQRPPFCVYGHAWVEKGPMCWDPNTKSTVPKSMYYLMGKINPQECFYYNNREEIRRLILSHNHAGPWEGPYAVPPFEEGEEDDE